jgi:ADP-heptose:LPS heptosyltransferase
VRALVYSAGGGIGDSLVSSVVAQALRQRYERVDALTLPGHRSTLERVPEYDAVLVDDGADERALGAALAERGYDACIVTWATSRTARVPQLAKIPIRVGQARRLYSHRFTQHVPVRSETGDVLSPWSDIQLDYARAIGCDAPAAVPHFIPTHDDEREAAALAGSMTHTRHPEHLADARHELRAKGVVEGPPAFLILHPTNAEATKRDIWPTQSWSALARALRERFDLPVLVSGTSADAPIVEAIAAGSGAISIAGKLGIGAFGALAKRARAFVGITTGTMHVAAAVGCPTVGIFPFQSDFPERWAPAGTNTAIVRPSYPCHKGDTKENCPDYACLANLDVPRIVAETLLLSSRA